jgi:hypothetical protein
MTIFVQIEGKQGLVRDLNSGAILNTNQTEYENYLTKKKQVAEQKQQLIQQQDDIDNIKNELADIKDLLKTLIREKHG